LGAVSAQSLVTRGTLETLHALAEYVSETMRAITAKHRYGFDQDAIVGAAFASAEAASNDSLIALNHEVTELSERLRSEIAVRRAQMGQPVVPRGGPPAGLLWLWDFTKWLAKVMGLGG
jgi:hypothetical protein